MKIFSKYDDYIILLALMLLGVLVSIFILSHESLRLDESQSLWQVSHSPAEILAIVAQDVHVPLYHLILHVWEKYFGNGVAVSRLLSLIFYLAAIPAIYFLGASLYDGDVGLMSAAMLGLSPFALWYANEIRMYSLLLLITILNLYFFYKIYFKNGEDRTHWIWYWLTGILGIYTHYFFLFVLLGEAIFIFAYWKAFSRNSIKKFLAVATSWFFLFLPWVLYVWRVGVASFSEPAIPSPTIISVFNTFSQFLFGFQSDPVNTFLLSLWPILVLFGFFTLERDDTSFPRESTLLILTIFVPITLVFALSYAFRPIYLTRYLIIALPAFFIISSRLLVYNGTLFFKYAKHALILGMIGAFLVQTLSAGTSVRENYKEAADIISSHASAQDVVLVSAPFTIYPIDYYYQGPATVSTLPVWNRNKYGPIPPFTNVGMKQEIDSLKGKYQNLWVLLSYDQGYEKDLRRYLDSNLEQILKEELSPHLTLLEYKLRYDRQNIEEAISEASSSKPNISAVASNQPNQNQ